MDDDIRVIGDTDLRAATGTPGMTRRVVDEDDGYWFGHVEAAPDTLSGWHHHGDMVTVGYVVKGRLRFEFGPGGSHSAEVGPGEFFRVPPRVVHREGNLTSEPGEVVLARIGEGPPVFPADGPDPD